jgi:hypothetical protein
MLSTMPRWRTFEPGNLVEATARAVIARQIAAWWAAFTQRAGAILAGYPSDLNDRLHLNDLMKQHFQVIDQRLCWEFASEGPQRMRLVLTPESHYDCTLLIEHILASAPTLPGWRFLGWRIPESIQKTRITVEGRTAKAWRASGCRFNRSDFNAIDVSFGYPSEVVHHDLALAQAQSQIAIETLIGEGAVNEWIGTVSVLEADQHELPLETCQTAFAAELKDIVSKRPTTLYADRAATSPWTSFSNEPDQSADYAAQFDLTAASCMDQELWQACHGTGLFHSSHFSGLECFCYLKIDRAGYLPGWTIDDREHLSGLIDDALRPLHLGGSIGGATGLRYSYIDLALTDWQRAMQVIRRILVANHLPERTWLLFYDSVWCNEWVGLNAASPAPFGVE